MLKELRSFGLDFETVPFSAWLQQMKASAANGDEVQNPAIKLIEYFETSYGGLGGTAEEDVEFKTTAAERDSAALRCAPRMIEDGYVKKFLRTWMGRWSVEEIVQTRE